MNKKGKNKPKLPMRNYENRCEIIKNDSEL